MTEEKEELKDVVRETHSDTRFEALFKAARTHLDETKPANPRLPT